MDNDCTSRCSSLHPSGNSRCGVAVQGVVGRMQSQIKLDVIDALGLRLTFNSSHFIAADRQLVILGRVEILELIDAVGEHPRPVF